MRQLKTASTHPKSTEFKARIIPINTLEQVGKGVKAIPVVKLEPGVSQVIKSFLADKDVCATIRVELKNSGCCDASLGIRTDWLLDSDLSTESDGLTFVVSPETYAITGDVTISYIDRPGQKGFVLTSSQPISEWDGFTVTQIET